MPKVSTNISLDADLKSQSIDLFKDLGMDLTTAVTIFLKQAIRKQGIPFVIERDVPNAETIDAFNEFYKMKKNPDAYKKYSSFSEAMKDVIDNEA